MNIPLNTLVLVILYLLVFGVGELLYYHGVAPTITRKIVHIGSGMISALLPLFLPLETAVLLGTVLSILMLISKRTKLLNSIHAIEEESLGAFLFGPSMIVTAFLFWPINIHIFQGACLILGLSDGLAGFIGKRYGKLLYRVTSTKTVEGSAIFFSMTALLLLVIVYVDHGAIGLVDIIRALYGSILLTVGEALCRTGWDNLLVSVASGTVLYFML